MDQGVQQQGSGGRTRDWGAVLLGVILISIGGYLVLKDTLKVNLPEISWDTAWPIILIAFGLVVLVRAMTDQGVRRRRQR